jgi:hypothetical protein
MPLALMSAPVSCTSPSALIEIPTRSAVSPTFTRDLHALADWLEQCGIHSVAMESTSVYWIPIYQILEARGLEVYLVNAQHVKNVPGRKTDVSDCQWLQYLHSVGLLRLWPKTSIQDGSKMPRPITGRWEYCAPASPFNADRNE